MPAIVIVEDAILQPAPSRKSVACFSAVSVHGAQFVRMMCANSERRPPGQPVEAGVIPVRGDPFASEFNCECREPCILGDISVRTGFLTEGFKYLPMPITGNDHRCVGLLQQCKAETEDILQRAWNFEYARMRAYTNHAGKYLRRNAIGRRTIDR